MEGFWYLFAALAVIWVVLSGYVFIMHGKQQQLKREIDLLKQDLAEEKDK